MKNLTTGIMTFALCTLLTVSQVCASSLTDDELDDIMFSQEISIIDNDVELNLAWDEYEEDEYLADEFEDDIDLAWDEYEEDEYLADEFEDDIDLAWDEYEDDEYLADEFEDDIDLAWDEYEEDEYLADEFEDDIDIAWDEYEEDEYLADEFEDDIDLAWDEYEEDEYLADEFEIETIAALQEDELLESYMYGRTTEIAYENGYEEEIAEEVHPDYVAEEQMLENYMLSTVEMELEEDDYYAFGQEIEDLYINNKLVALYK